MTEMELAVVRVAKKAENGLVPKYEAHRSANVRNPNMREGEAKEARSRGQTPTG